MVTHEHGDTACDKGNAHTEQSAVVGEQQDAPQTGDIKNCTNVAEENTVAPELALMTESTKATEDIHDASGMQIVGDLGGNWKAVMHEQSNQCYYWNTVTGETSWEMPNALSSGIASDGVASASVPTAHMDYSFEPQAHAVPQNTLEVYPSDMSAVNGTSTYATFGMDSASAQYTQDAYAYTAAAASHPDIDPLQLAKYGEDLLQRLNQLERLHGSGEGLELTRREIGIRISDCNALSSYGSSLLPLWLHTEVHLKQLESSISKLETSDEVHLRQLDSSISKLETSDEVHLKQLDSSISKLETSDVEPRCSKTEDKEPNEGDITVPSNGEDSKLEARAAVTAGDNVKIEEPGPTSAAQNSHDKDAEVVSSNVKIDNDEDMDVEMEVDEDDVEEQVNSSCATNKEHPTLEVHSLPPGPAPPENNDVPPPPPEEEWIPPPPPDSEPAPPPPPEEPVASYVHPDTIPQSYIGQANVGYTLAGMEYYASVGTEGTNATYYVQSSEPHVPQEQQHSYYAPVSANCISLPVDGTSIAPESYYTYPSVPTAGGGVAAEHSGYYASSVSAISSSAVEIESSASLVSANSNSYPTFKGSDKVMSKDPGVPPLSQAATSAAETTSMLGSSTHASTSTTNQTKARSKKRAVTVTSSLRSNKKVSSLVDKWKAAKEELLDEEEEEPEDTLEALERKRQKEIEEWRKQQIASGEAQENANFVPVRGDWRDRVKRRRAEAKKVSKEESLSDSLSSAEQQKSQPDLAELSKGLPYGWQAYLDEYTKQVYYGNSLTSETSWARPTK